MDHAQARAARVEIAAMTALLLSYIWIWQRAFDGHGVVMGLAYAALGLLSHLRRGETARDIGLRLDNLPQALIQALMVVAPLVLLTLLVGRWLDGHNLPPVTRVPALLFEGTLWGTAQQYGLLAFYYRRVRDVMPDGPRAMIVASSFFAVYHLPNPFLTGVTLVVGVVACWLYRRIPNVLAIGFAHALLSLAFSRGLPIEITFGQRVGPGFFRIVEQLQSGT